MDREADVEETASLRRLAQRCAKVLERLQDKETMAKQGFWVSRQCAEFNLWCAKVGVNGQGQRSIDVRLKDVPETLGLIRGLVESLEIDLKKILHPGDNSKPASAHSSDSGTESDGSLSFDSLSSLEDTRSENSTGSLTADEKEALAVQKHVEDTLERLHGHALQIDRAGAKHRQERIKMYQQKEGPKYAYQGYREVAYRKAQVQFPAASDSFHQRMADSFARRRTRLDYLREHQKKRAIESLAQDAGPRGHSHTKVHPQGLKNPSATGQSLRPTSQAPSKQNEKPGGGGSIHTITEETKLDKKLIIKKQERPESVASIATRHPDFPPAPRFTGASFQCPYCRLDFRAAEAEKSRWTQHVMQDFEPYFCIFDKCDSPFDMENTYYGFLEHLHGHVEDRYHVDLPNGEHRIFDEAELEDYLRRQEPTTDMAPFKQSARRKGAVLLDKCPFCGGYPDILEKDFPDSRKYEAQMALRRHIKQHMQDVAMFLPPCREDVLDKDDQSSIFSRPSSGDLDDSRTLCDTEGCDCKTTRSSDDELPVSLEELQLINSAHIEATGLGFRMSYAGRFHLTKEDCIRDETLYKFLKASLRLSTEKSSDGLHHQSESSPSGLQTDIPTHRRPKRPTILSPSPSNDYEALQRKYMDIRCPGTFQWLLDCEAFQAWASVPSQTFSCYGIPGSGKTILTSLVIDYITKRFGADETVGIAFIYCNHKKARASNNICQDLLTDILKQLAEMIPSTTPELEFLYSGQKTPNASLSTSDVRHTIEQVAGRFSRIFIIIDALDEIGEIGQGRTKFLAEMVKLHKARGFNIFLTSRPIVRINDKFLFLASQSIEDNMEKFLAATSKRVNVPQGFGGHMQMDFCATNEDIRCLIESRLPRLPSVLERDVDLRKEFENRIIEAADGMILAANGRLDWIELLEHPDFGDEHGEHKTRHMMLNTFSDANFYCSDLLAEAFERINEQEPDRRLLSDQALSIVCHSMRELRVAELQHALAASEHPKLPDIDSILSSCAGLLTVDDWSDVVSISHYAIMRYLDDHRPDWATEGHCALANACLNYISSRSFSKALCSTTDELETRFQAHPFYSYAASNWGHHARLGQPRHGKQLELLNSEPLVQASAQALMVNQYNADVLGAPGNMTGLHLAAFFGLTQVLETLLQLNYLHNVDERDSHRRTPLMYASEQGHSDVANLLLAFGGDVNASDKDGDTPLHFAVRRDHNDLAELLLEKGPNPDSQNVGDVTPLHIACEGPGSSIVYTLLAFGAFPELIDDRGMTPLLRAVINGRETNARLLIDAGADINTQDNDGMSALSIAALLGHDKIVKQLGGMDAIINIVDFNGWTPLMHAASNGHESTARLLLEKGADVNAKGDQGWDPLLLAACQGHESLVLLLLDWEADVNSTMDGGYTPLLVAAYRGYTSIVRRLCRHGKTNIEARDKFGQTPLLVVARHGHEEAVRFLLLFGADIEARERRFGQTPLLMAVRKGHLGVFTVLCNRYADLEAVGKDGKNARDLAAEGSTYNDTVMLERLTRSEVMDTLRAS